VLGKVVISREAQHWNLEVTEGMANPPITARVILNEVTREQDSVWFRAPALCVRHGGVQSRQARNAPQSPARIAEQVHVTEL